MKTALASQITFAERAGAAVARRISGPATPIPGITIGRRLRVGFRLRPGGQDRNDADRRIELERDKRRQYCASHIVKNAGHFVIWRYPDGELEE